MRFVTFLCFVLSYITVFLIAIALFGQVWKQTFHIQTPKNSTITSSLTVGGIYTCIDRDSQLTTLDSCSIYSTTNHYRDYQPDLETTLLHFDVEIDGWELLGRDNSTKYPPYVIFYFSTNLLVKIYRISCLVMMILLFYLPLTLLEDHRGINSFLNKMKTYGSMIFWLIGSSALHWKDMNIHENPNFRLCDNCTIISTDFSIEYGGRVFDFLIVFVLFINIIHARERKRLFR